MAEVSVDANKKVTVHKMTVVGDIGPIVNLSGAENQVQGCIVDAIGTLALEVDIENGRIKQQNFDTYRLPRMPISPPVDVHFLDTNYPPTGVGEPAFPPAVPGDLQRDLRGHRPPDPHVADHARGVLDLVRASTTRRNERARAGNCAGLFHLAVPAFSSRRSRGSP